MSENVNHKLIVAGDIHLQDKEPKKSQGSDFLNWLFSQDFNNENNSLLLLGDLCEINSPYELYAIYVDYLVNKSKFKSNSFIYNISEDKKRVEELVSLIQKEYAEKQSTKWWIMPNFDCFEQYNPSIGLNYFIEEQKDSYSRSRPPLKSDFNSKEEAEKWLKNYLKEEELFNSAKDEIDNLNCNLGLIYDKLQKHEYITEDDWTNCFRMFNESRLNGALSKVTKDE